MNSKQCGSYRVNTRHKQTQKCFMFSLGFIYRMYDDGKDEKGLPTEARLIPQMKLK